MTSVDDIHALADSVFAAIEAGDVESVAAIWADDVVVWHNNDQIEQDKAANLRVLAWMVDNSTARQYRDVRRTIVDDGFAQQHVLHLDLVNGRTLDLPAALFVRVADGKVSRIDEYLDAAAVTAAFAP